MYNNSHLGLCLNPHIFSGGCSLNIEPWPLSTTCTQLLHLKILEDSCSLYLLSSSANDFHLGFHLKSLLDWTWKRALGFSFWQTAAALPSTYSSNLLHLKILVRQLQHIPPSAASVSNFRIALSLIFSKTHLQNMQWKSIFIFQH